MSAILKQARLFFEACETGKGRAGCRAYCLPNATFSSQTGALASINTLEAYSEWMKNLFTPYQMVILSCASFARTRLGTALLHTLCFTGLKPVRGGPSAPTGKMIAADYVYAMQ